MGLIWSGIAVCATVASGEGEQVTVPSAVCSQSKISLVSSYVLSHSHIYFWDRLSTEYSYATQNIVRHHSKRSRTSTAHRRHCAAYFPMMVSPTGANYFLLARDWLQTIHSRAFGVVLPAVRCVRAVNFCVRVNLPTWHRSRPRSSMAVDQMAAVMRYCAGSVYVEYVSNPGKMRWIIQTVGPPPSNTSQTVQVFPEMS